MKKKIRSRIGNFFTCNEQRRRSPLNLSNGVVDVREEYANAFRTESYLEFWTRVLEVSNEEYSSISTPQVTINSTSAARLSSYRLFVEHLLEPNQATITRILNLPNSFSTTHNILLSDYFTKTANTSILCGLMLKDIKKIRVKYRLFQDIIQSLEINPLLSINNQLYSSIFRRLTKFSNSMIPFISSSTMLRVQAIQVDCSKLLKHIESVRDKARTKLWFVNKIKHSSAIVIVTLTVSLSIIVVTHALPLILATPSLLVASFELKSSKMLNRVNAQLDVAAKGTYILNRDLDTITRLVTRLNDELEHMVATIKFWLQRGEDWRQASGEVARQLKKIDSNFREQLDDLEEHLYLCFMTINRSRKLVVKEIVDPGRPVKA